MMKRTLSFILAFVMCIAALPQIALANGGPTATSDYLIGGNISFVGTPDIFVEKEDLRVTLSPRTSVVTAVYTLKNTGGEKTIDYIFPISRYSRHSYWFEDANDRGKVEWVAFYDGDKKLAYRKLEEPVNKSYLVDLEYMEDIELEYGELTAYYYHTKLNFAPNETKTLTVTYKAANAFTFGYEDVPHYFLMEDIKVGFLYDLRPAAAWGNGKAGEFNLTIDYSDLLYTSDVKLNIDGFRREPSGVFNFAAKDFDFAEQGFVSVVFEYPFWLDEMERDQLSNNYLEKIYVSSTLQSSTDAYSAENLFDGDVNTAWVEGAKGDGIGETIEVVIQKPDWPVGLVLLNGYMKNEDVYYNNGRIKKLKVESFYMDENGKIDYENKFYLQEQIIEFDDVPYDEIDFNRVLNNGEPIIISTRSFVRFTILEVYPGQKYDDTCISEIYLMGSYLDGYDEAGYELVTKPIK